MPQLSFIVDDTTAAIIKETSKKHGVSQSHYLNNLVQRSLMLENSAEDIESFLMQPKMMTVYKKILIHGLENLALTQYLVRNLGDDGFKKANETTLKEARQHAESYVSGLFDA